MSSSTLHQSQLNVRKTSGSTHGMYMQGESYHGLTRGFRITVRHCASQNYQRTLSFTNFTDARCSCLHNLRFSIGTPAY
jgi:hypothetical protein